MLTRQIDVLQCSSFMLLEIQFRLTNLQSLNMLSLTIFKTQPGTSELLDNVEYPVVVSIRAYGQAGTVCV